VSEDAGIVALLDRWRQAETELHAATTPLQHEQWELEAARCRAEYLRALEREHERGRASIRFLDDSTPTTDTVEFVGGPRAGERVTLADGPASIEMETGIYVRSVRCADDGASRYVWSADPTERHR
jgi:hypothetical protein